MCSYHNTFVSGGQLTVFNCKDYHGTLLDVRRCDYYFFINRGKGVNAVWVFACWDISYFSKICEIVAPNARVESDYAT